jgi:uncharacterized membrane protein YebE (DUF533 family)
MFNAGNLLSDLMKTGLSGQSVDRIKHAMNQGGLGDVGAQLSQMFGGQGEGGGGTSGGSMGSGSMAGLAERAKAMFGQAGDAVKSGDKLAIGGLGALVGTLLGGGGGAVKGAVGGGAMALLGLLAYNAFKEAGQAPAAPAERDLPLGLRPPEDQGEEQALEHQNLLALRAMISAAKADGHIDPAEQQRILGKLDEFGEDEEAKQFVAREMAAPASVEELARAVPDQQAAAQIYAASLLAIKVDSEVEKDYLRRLATALGLDRAVVANLHQVLGAPAIA